MLQGWIRKLGARARKMQVSPAPEKGAVRVTPGWSSSPPVRAQIEVTNRCNLRCVMCPLSDPDYAPEGGYRHLTVEAFGTLLDHLGNPSSISLQGLGEPLLNPWLPELVALATLRGLTVSFVTNGMLLTQQKARQLIEAGLHRVVFSVDGSSEATFQTIRRGGQLERLLQNIRGFVEVRDQHSVARPEVGVMTVAMKENQHEIPEIIEQLSAIGVHDFTVKHILEGAGAESAQGALDEDEVQRLRQALLRTVARTGARVQMPASATMNHPATRTCNWPFEAVYVKVNGDVGPCCFGFDAIHSNALEADGDAVWNSAPLRRFREDFVTGIPDLCVRCPAYSLKMEVLSA